MKAVVCEMCGGRDLLKQGDAFVCQHCGTKYTVEEAKKLMVEIEGAVRIDNSDTIQRSLQNARRAKDKEDWNEVEKYYNMVEEHDPSNIEAIFYSAYGKAKGALIENDQFKREAAFRTLTKSVSILDDAYDVTKEQELKQILLQITTDTIRMVGSQFVYTKTVDKHGITTDNAGETRKLFRTLIEEMIRTLSNIIAKFPENRYPDIEYIFMCRLNLCDLMGTSLAVKRRDWLVKCAEYAAEIKTFCPTSDLKDYPAIIEEFDKKEAKEVKWGCIKLLVFGVAFCVGMYYLIRWIIS